MNPNNSFHSSAHSEDTDILIKIPNNFFETNLEKSHFSNDNEFISELDNFLHVERYKDVQNSTVDDRYTEFKDTLHKTDEDLNLQEERLKRQHQEQLTNILQKKIIQYQQKIFFLTRNVHEKDQLVLKLSKNEGLDEENSRLKQKIATLEEEVNNTIQLINKFQSKNDALELKIENLTMTSSEMREISKKQIKDLEIRLSNSQLKEQELHEEIEKLRDNCKTEKDNHIKIKHLRSLLDREVNSLKSQLKHAKDENSRLHEKYEKDKQTIEVKQKKIFNSLMDEFADKERKLIKELDMQRMALKNYYQAQLESALEEKVAEFQEQLETFQNEIRHEADKRERTHSERAIQQMEMIVRKNEEEIDLINQKCLEEVELYKVQLLNASRTIESLESKLHEYQIRRHSIADNLHSIMEVQWKKTLEILTNPSKLKHNEEFLSNDVSETDNNQQFQQQHEHVMNNLSRSEENLKSEMLRNYIDMLLKQSPKFNQVNEDPNSLKGNGKAFCRMSKYSKPWK